MRFQSTNQKENNTTLKEALLSGLATDGGLFMPASLPLFSKKQLKDMASLSFQEIALAVAKPFVCPEVSEEKLKEIITQAFNFEVPIKEIYENMYALELFHGPTLSFKDFGSRFLARLMSHFMQGVNQKLTGGLLLDAEELLHVGRAVTSVAGWEKVGFEFAGCGGLA